MPSFTPIYLDLSAVEGLSGALTKRLRRELKYRIKAIFPLLAYIRAWWIKVDLSRYGDVEPWFLFFFDTGSAKRSGDLRIFRVSFEAASVFWVVTPGIDPDKPAKSPGDRARGGDMNSGGEGGEGGGETAARAILQRLAHTQTIALEMRARAQLRAISLRLRSSYARAHALLTETRAALREAIAELQFDEARERQFRIVEFLENPALQFAAHDTWTELRERHETIAACVMKHFRKFDRGLKTVLSDDGLFVPELFGVKADCGGEDINRYAAISDPASALQPAWSACEIALHNERLQI